jgi:hypothetical protein
MIETPVRPLEPTDLGSLSSGRGGDGWGDDSGDEWGWSEGPWGDDEDDGPPYRRSRVMRGVALATVVAVVAGSIGTWVVFLAVGAPQTSFAVSSVHTDVSAAATTEQSAVVHFVVSNETLAPAAATCVATLTTAETTVGSAAVQVPRVQPGGSTNATARVVIRPATLSGHGPVSIRVGCAPSVHPAR